MSADKLFQFDFHNDGCANSTKSACHSFGVQRPPRASLPINISLLAEWCAARHCFRLNGNQRAKFSFSQIHFYFFCKVVRPTQSHAFAGILSGNGGGAQWNEAFRQKYFLTTVAPAPCGRLTFICGWLCTFHCPTRGQGYGALPRFAFHCGAAKDCNAAAAVVRAWRNARSHARFAMKIDRTRGFEMVVDCGRRGDADNMLKYTSSLGQQL